MKNFIYHENGWRWFEAEELPVKPILWDEIRTEKYNNAISALKAKSLPVGNEEIIKFKEISFGTESWKKILIGYEFIPFIDGQIIEWPGSVDVKEAIKRTFITNGRADYNPIKQVAILKLPSNLNH